MGNSQIIINYIIILYVLVILCYNRVMIGLTGDIYE